MMPAISLHQPWASALMLGPKEHETRGFRLPANMIGVDMLLHAARRPPRSDEFDHEGWEVVRGLFGSHGLQLLPLGAFLGRVRFSADHPTEHGPNSREDRLLGDWSPGRRAWYCDRRHPFIVPVAAIGRQRFWYVDIIRVAGRTLPL